MHAYFCITNPINKEDPQHLNNPGIIHNSAMILRLVNDWRTSRDEMLKGDIVKLSQHYMRESGCSKRKLGSTSIATAEMWKKLSIELVMMERCTPYWLSYPTSPPQIQRESIIYLVKDSKYHKTAKLYLNCLGTETKSHHNEVGMNGDVGTAVWEEDLDRPPKPNQRFPRNAWWVRSDHKRLCGGGSLRFIWKELVTDPVTLTMVPESVAHCAKSRCDPMIGWVPRWSRRKRQRFAGINAVALEGMAGLGDSSAVKETTTCETRASLWSLHGVRRQIPEAILFSLSRAEMRRSEECEDPPKGIVIRVFALVHGRSQGHWGLRCRCNRGSYPRPSFHEDRKSLCVGISCPTTNAGLMVAGMDICRC
nr:(-)-alpha-terpineol synthase-like [Ipomoea batatas]